MTAVYDFWVKQRVKKLAAIEQLQKELEQVDATIRLLGDQAPKPKLQEVPLAPPPFNPFTDKKHAHKRGYRRKFSWEGVEDDLKEWFNTHASRTTTVNEMYDVIRQKPLYQNISKASVGAYMAGLRRAGFLEAEIFGREYLYCKNNKAV